MTRVMTVQDIKELISRISIKNFFLKLIDQLKSDFARWDEFEKSPRHAVHAPDGVLELMPISDKLYYTFKYVNGHPNNPLQKKATVMALGMLAAVDTGYPLLFSEMTLLTALRTAATSALASTFLCRKDAKTFGIIGTGAQSEFQVLAHHFGLGLKEIYYFDKDPAAMKKFAHNLASFGLSLVPCQSGREVLEKCDLITTATAAMGHHKVLETSWLKPGIHINKIGGDSPGKTELEKEILPKCKIVVELLEQTKAEGEIQQVDAPVHAALWELAAEKKKGRETDDEMTLFDSVGFALEDYSVLRLVFELANQYNIGHQLDMIPETPDPKDLFGVLL